MDFHIIHLEVVNRYEVLYEVQDLMAFFETQRMNLKLFSFLQMDYPLGIGFFVCKLP
jgi:hypothetical protein